MLILKHAFLDSPNTFRGNKLFKTITTILFPRLHGLGQVSETRAVPFKEPPCHQIHTDSSWSDHSSGPTSRHRLMTSPHSFPASRRPVGSTGSACATGSMRPASRRQRGTCPRIAGRWCRATRASSLGGRRTWRNQPGPPAPCGRVASPSGRRAPNTFWMLQHSSHSCCTPDNICIPSCVPSGNLGNTEDKKKCFVTLTAMNTTVVRHWNSCMLHQVLGLPLGLLLCVVSLNKLNLAGFSDNKQRNKQGWVMSAVPQAIWSICHH